MSRPLIPRHRTKLRRRRIRWQQTTLVRPFPEPTQRMQQIWGMGYAAGTELKEINRLLAEREALVLQTIAMRLEQAEANGQCVESAEREAYQLFRAFSKQLTALEEEAGQVMANILTNIERRIP